MESMDAYPPVVIAPVAARAPAPARRDLAFEFTGNASEYFRIWIVNTLLTILTLGIYSAWAKVRNKQYFYRHLRVDGSSFEYLANPVAILKGRLIAAAALGLLFGSQYYSPILYGALLVALLLVTPWVVVKALAFNARNSAYRNIRFAFVGRTGEAAGLYLGMTLLNVVSCGTGLPYVEWRFTSFFVWRHLYGDLPFRWHSQSSQYYKAYLVALALAVPGFVMLVALMFTLTRGRSPEDMNAVFLPVMAGFYAYLLVPGAFLRASLANLLYNGMQIGEHRLSSRQRGSELLALYVTNLLGIILSLGLLIPWAKVRLAAYRARCLTLHATGSLRAERLVDEEHSAIGEGMTDLGDFDLGIGV